MVEWKDVTEYDKKTKEKDRVPRSHEIDTGGLRITVSRWTLGSETRWYLSTNLPMVEEFFELTSTDLGEAKKQALGLVRKQVEELSSDLKGIK